METWRVEDGGMVCADPGPHDVAPYGDVVCVHPDAGADEVEAFARSEELWPARAARMCAAINALVGHDETDFAQIVEDAMMIRWAAGLGQDVSIDDMRDEYRKRNELESNPE